MPFGLKQKLNETEKFQKKLDKSFKKTAHKQMVLDTLQTKRALKAENKKLKLYKTTQGITNTTDTNQSIENISNDQTSVNGENDVQNKNTSKVKDYFDMVLINLEYFFSNLAQSIRNHKKIVSLVVCAAAVIISVTGIYSYLVCYDINLDGNNIGIVRSHAQLNEALDDLQEDLQKEYGLDSLYFERSITSKKVIIFNREEILSSEEIYNTAKNANLPLFCIGGVINIDGVDTVKLSSVEKAEEALNSFYNYYKTSSADWLKILSVKDIDTQQNIKINEKVISIGSDCSVDEAVSYLKSLCANAIEQSRPNGRVVIAELPSFSYAYANTPETGSVNAGATENGEEVKNFDEPDSKIAEMAYTVPSTALAFRVDLSAKDEVDTSLLLNVQMTSEVEYYRIIPYETVEYDNSSLYKGERIVTTKGVDGKSYVKANLISENGIQVSEEILEENVYEEPVNEMIALGTRPLPVLNGESNYIMPTTGRVSSTNREGSHSGFKAVDIANREGTGIYAARAGRIIFATEDNSGYGKYIKIDHGDGYVTWYAHLSEFKVSVGDYVNQGELIGLMGNTGRSTGPHLHLEIRLNNVQQYIPAFYNIDYNDYVYAFE